MLRDYGSLDDVASAADKLFAQARPVFLLLADAGGLMQVEIGQHGRYRLIRQQSGTLAHTNHYADTSLLDGAQTIGPSSQARLERIRFLLDQHPAHTLSEFERLSRDRHDGPDNSLWRSGREHTLAGWRIALPAGAPPRLQLTLANPGHAERDGDYALDARSGRSRRARYCRERTKDRPLPDCLLRMTPGGLSAPACSSALPICRRC
ncbi:carcinine hydrolase/isopenicillin-N N-acyltransferase family protein [Chromobacterium violaceum]|uniref:carcinine hydrolase/isopenicillin-N N-acyltransferase family protein n=1 Tax=Chromobacterium violaceum TaxID=536 RepID=UPI002418B113|nr:carcinine hydrolase/isopenicillin-N N-acyltransferase family protein [Chromobacterium violaceum]